MSKKLKTRNPYATQLRAHRAKVIPDKREKIRLKLDGKLLLKA